MADELDQDLEDVAVIKHAEAVEGRDGPDQLTILDASC